MPAPVSSQAFPEVAPILALLLKGLENVLGQRLVGVYLYGSLITGDFDPARSDIDLVVVLASELDDEVFTALHQLHTSVVERHPLWDDRLELAYISAAALRSFRARSSEIGIISPGEPFHRVQAGSDWLISWYALRADGIALQGPPIQTLLDPITDEEYLLAVRQHIERYRASVKKPHDKPALAYIVLTVARGLYTLRQGEPTSKTKAAAWARQRYPQWSALLDLAAAWRANPSCDSLTAAEVRPLVARYVEDMLARLPD